MFSLMTRICGHGVFISAWIADWLNISAWGSGKDWNTEFSSRGTFLDIAIYVGPSLAWSTVLVLRSQASTLAVDHESTEILDVTVN